MICPLVFPLWYIWKYTFIDCIKAETANEINNSQYEKFVRVRGNGIMVAYHLTRWIDTTLLMMPNNFVAIELCVFASSMKICSKFLIKAYLLRQPILSFTLLLHLPLRDNYQFNHKNIERMNVLKVESRVWIFEFLGWNYVLHSKCMVARNQLEFACAVDLIRFQIACPIVVWMGKI